MSCLLDLHHIAWEAAGRTLCRSCANWTDMEGM